MSYDRLSAAAVLCGRGCSLPFWQTSQSQAVCWWVWWTTQESSIQETKQALKLKTSKNQLHWLPLWSLCCPWCVGLLVKVPWLGTYRLSYLILFGNSIIFIIPGNDFWVSTQCWVLLSAAGHRRQWQWARQRVTAVTDNHRVFPLSRESVYGRLIYFMCRNVAPACISTYHMWACCLQRREREVTWKQSVRCLCTQRTRCQPWPTGVWTGVGHWLVTPEVGGNQEGVGNEDR